MTTISTEQFTTRLVAVARDLSLLLAHEPDDRVVAALDQMRRNLDREFAEIIPGPQGPAIIDTILDGIQARRLEIQRGSSGNAQMRTLQ
jgi:hypothetical protein